MYQGFRVVPLTMVMGTIFFLSHQPGTDLSFFYFPGSDKVAHAVAYACLAATAIYSIPQHFRASKPTFTAMLVVAFCLVYGMSDEYHQSFIPGRETSLGDLQADTLGAVVVAGGWILFTSRRNPGKDSGQG